MMPQVVVPGALNLRLPDLRVLKVTTVGSGYDSSDVGDTLTQSSTSGGGSGMQVNITGISSTGTLQECDFNYSWIWICTR
jgi:hypothetical protein